MSREKLTTPDLVLLSLLAERPLHGYQANALLEFRKVREWAGVSRPQVYYSIEKLAQHGLIHAASPNEESSGGPARNIFETTASGREALADALERDDWVNQNDRPAFLTWLGLSWQCRPGVFPKQLRRRRMFLEQEMTDRQKTLSAVRKEVGHRFHEAVWMLSLTIGQLRTELRWIEKLQKESPRRAAAYHPDYLQKKDNSPGSLCASLFTAARVVRIFRCPEYRKNSLLLPTRADQAVIPKSPGVNRITQLCGSFSLKEVRKLMFAKCCT